MKKTVISCVMAVGLASASFGGVLYWQVNGSPTTVTDVNGGIPSDTVSNDFNNWNTAKIAYYTTDTTTSNPNQSGTAMEFTPANYPDEKMYNTGKAQATTQKYAMSADSSYSSGVFYIELYNGSTLVGRSKEYLTYDSAKQEFTSSNGTDVFDGQLSFFDGIQTWNGGSTYVAVPEPTSGVMLLLGAALLGLRRRRV